MSTEFFQFSGEIVESIRNIKEKVEPKLLGPAFSFLSHESKTEISRRLLQVVNETDLDNLRNYREYFNFDFRDKLFRKVAGLEKNQTQELCWKKCMNACMGISTSYSKNLNLSTALGDLVMPMLFNNVNIRCVKADKVKEYPDYKLVLDDNTLAYIDFKYRAVPYFFINKKPYNLLCYYSIAEDIAKIKEHYGQIQRSRKRGSTVHPTYHLFFVDYPCSRCLVFQDVEILNRIMSKSGRTRRRKNVWTKRKSRRTEANIFTYFSLLTDLREVSDLLNVVNTSSNCKDFKTRILIMKKQDKEFISRLYGDET